MNLKQTGASNFSDQYRPRSEQELRIDELKLKVQEVTEGEFSTGYESPDCPPDIKEAFWEHILAYESAPLTTRLIQLEEDGVTLPPADTLDDEALTNKLWEVIRQLAKRRVFLSCTDHLSDRELYEDLRTDLLCQLTPDFKADEDSAWHLDVVGSGSEEDTYLYLKYYADEQWRRDWAKDFPEDEMPPHEAPPYQRDWLLPQRTYGPPEIE